ncbi:MAG: hypothetical protein ACE5I3_08665 [Phycisphaerae bacterium]
MTREAANTLRRFEWLLPTLLAALAATRLTPLVAPATLVLLCWLPGRYVIAGFGLAGNWDAAGRFVLAVAASLAITPVLLNPVWHFTNTPWPLLAYIWLLLTVGYWLSRLGSGAAGFSPRGWPRRLKPAAREAVLSDALHLFDRTRTKIVIAGVAALVAFAAIGTYWPTELRGYPVPALIHDFIKHHGVLFSLEQRPLPLGNPFFADDAVGPVFYYHFFYLIPATVRALSPGLSIELAFGMQAALVGICTAGMFYLIVKRFSGGDGPATLAALLATAIGGLDILPVVACRMAVITLDAWADTLVRIHNFFTQIVWTPQNVQGVLILLLGAYLLSLKGWWKGWFVLGPILAAGLIGSSVWVAAGVLPGLVVFVLFEVVRQRRQPRLALKRLLLSAVVALLMLAMALPSVLGYLEMAHRHGKALTAKWPYQRDALLGKLAPPGVLANLLDLPWMLALEFGPLLLLPVLLPRRIWQRAWNDAGLRLLLISGGVALTGFVSVRSHFTYNDFGQKIILVAMAAGAVLAACLLAPAARRPSPLNPLGWSLHEQTPTRPRRMLAAFVGLVLVLGLPVGLYQSPLAAVRRYISKDSPLRMFAHPGALRAEEEEGATRFLRDSLPGDAVVQAHWGAQRLDLLQIARKQIGVTALERDTMVFFPTDAEAHQRTLQTITEVLEQPTPARRCHETLRRHGITHVFVGTVERQLWRGLEKFADERLFERVFHADESTVYALR